MRQTALVTGAGKRLGHAMAMALGARGYRVGVHYNGSEADANNVVTDIIAAGGKAVALQANLSEQPAVEALIERAASALACPVTLLVNSASTFEHDDIETMTAQSWDLHMLVNLRAPAFLTQAFARQCPADANGLIVNLIDQRVKKLTPQFLSYTASKSALMTLTITMAQALATRGIRVNAIGPGPTMRNARQSEDDWQKQNRATILGYGATPDDITAALFYLIDAKAVTGQMIAVDGGQHLGWQTPDVMIKE